MEVKEAQIEGIHETSASKEIATKKLVEEIIEETMQTQSIAASMVDATMTGEIVGILRGLYSPELIYNKPVWSAKGEKEHRACKRMKGGCPYVGQTHEHIVGVGINGAKAAMRAYGQLTVKIQEIPVIVDRADKLYWAVEVTAIDNHNDNVWSEWYFQPVMLKTRNGFIEIEHGSEIAQHKAMRNAILALIPSQVMLGWIEDYLNGKDDPFNNTLNKPVAEQAMKIEATKDEKPKPKHPPKQESIQVGPHVKFVMNQNTIDVVARFAESIKLPNDKVRKFCLSKYNNTAQCLLNLTRVLNGEANLDELKQEIVDFIASAEAETSEEEEVQHKE